LSFVLKFSVLVFFFSSTNYAQYREANRFEDNVDYTGLVITVYTQDNYSLETNVLISKSDLIYLNVQNVFNSLKIKCLPNLNGFEGFIENQTNLYTINFNEKKIKVGDKSINIEDHIVEEFGIKYIEASVISEIFGLSFNFNPRTVTAKLVSSFEPPFFKQRRMEKYRNTISVLQGDAYNIDTIIPRNYHLFKLGTLDWGMVSTQSLNTGSNYNASVSLGSELLFGEANFFMNYNPKNKFDIEQLRYRWRWIDNDKKIIKQVQLGMVFSESVSNLGGSLIGATINNSSNTIEKARGNYTISDITEPNWGVELYINDVLVDYTVADAAGLYQFKVPVVYGYITTKLKFYGPLGEERNEESVLSRPYTFANTKQLLYNLTTGIVQDSLKSSFARADFNYGVAPNLTVNGGLEYFSNNPKGVLTPFANIAFQPYSKMILNLNYIPNKSLNGLMNLYITKSSFLNINYSKPLDGYNSLLSTLKVDFTMPLKMKIFGGFTRIKYSRYIYKSFAYNLINLNLSSRYKQLRINSSTLINWASGNSPQISSNLMLSKNITRNLTLRTSTQYNLISNNLESVSANFQLRVAKMIFIANYSRNIQSKSNSFSISTAYDLPFSRIGVSSAYSNNNLNFSEDARGSLTFGEGYKNVNTGNNSAMGKGTILLYPFLDLNRNDILDNGEKKVLLTSVRVPAGNADISKKDSIVRVADLNAFVNYTIEFSDTDLDYVSWRFKHKTYQILVDPNQHKHVFVPIIPVGEVSGVVYLKSEKTTRAQSNVTLQIYDKKGIKVAETMSEFDGYFSYLGLKPGTYTVRVDEAQLKNLKYQAFPAVHPVTIKISEYGDIVGGLDFILNDRAP
jgi:hypothetical protein